MAEVRPHPRLLVRMLPAHLARYAYRSGDERQLHDGIAAVLDSLGVSYRREHAIDDRNRFDFWVEEAIAIEVKVKGSFAEAIRQVDRYIALEAVAGVVLVTTRMWDSTAINLRGKPVFAVRVSRQAF